MPDTRVGSVTSRGRRYLIGTAIPLLIGVGLYASYALAPSSGLTTGTSLASSIFPGSYQYFDPRMQLFVSSPLVVSQSSQLITVERAIPVTSGCHIHFERTYIAHQGSFLRSYMPLGHGSPSSANIPIYPDQGLRVAPMGGQSYFVVTLTISHRCRATVRGFMFEYEMGRHEYEQYLPQAAFFIPYKN